MKDKKKTVDKKSKNLKLSNRQLREKGITLIALVVTIVILLILAGVTLNIALSDNGLFNKTKEAVSKTKLEMEKEQLQTAMITAFDVKTRRNRL